jgi:outer membrane protein assembly factor BamA
MPITEPAVGYGAAGGLAFLSKPLPNAEAGYGRPNISMIGGFGTENGSHGFVVGDLRHWFDDRLQTMVGAVYASVNLDFYGIGDDSLLHDSPLKYTLEPKGGTFQARYRIGDSLFWGGLNYSYAQTRVSFEAPAGTPGLPNFQSDSSVGGLTPAFTYDSRDNMFTPTNGTFAELAAGFYGRALGSDEDFQRARVMAMHFFPLGNDFYLGIRGDATASFGEEPFYMRPFVAMRGVPVMRYQGEEVAQGEAELRWQFWGRWSAVGFCGAGAAWNDFERVENPQSVVAGGTGFRYELARKYGIHMGLDVAFSQHDTAIYIQVGSAWARP